jgi:UDP-glucose 4-epimerase
MYSRVLQFHYSKFDTHSNYATPMMISVVGYTGFIGRHLHNRLKGKHDISGFNSSELPFYVNELNPKIKNQDVIYWLATSVNPNSAEDHSAEVSFELESWSKFLKLLLAAPPKKLVFLSSGGCVYKDGPPPFLENSPTEGTNAYGRLKLEMEHVLRESKIPYTILRVANVYGPGQPIGRGQGVIAEWTNSIAANEPLPLFGSSTVKRDFIYLDDVCNAIEAGSKYMDDSIFNIGSGKAVPLQDLYSLLKEITGSDLKLAQYGSRKVDRETYYLDISKATHGLNWKPKVSMEHGLRIVLDERGVVLG